jgi:PAS domain S-box-containing protein
MSQAKPIVLIVDDNEQKRYVLARHLKQAGFEIWEAASGEEAIRLARQQPSVIALDVQLPDIIGYEVSRRLRSDPATASIPIVQISATFTTPDSRAKGLECGADTFLTGSIEPEELVATMNAMIRMRRAEAMAKNFATQWQTTFDAISDAVCLVNTDGTIERCNLALATLLNIELSQVPGRNLLELVECTALDPSVYVRMLSSRHREVTERQADDKWFAISAEPVLDNEGTFKGGVLIISNITDRKRAEQVREREQAWLQQEAERLEAKVQERTRELEAIIKSMESFCYTIAHDLRTPLRAVSGFTSALLEKYSASFDEEGHDFAKRIVNASSRMDVLINELLAFGRLSHADLPRGSVDLNHVLNTVLAHHAIEIKESQAVLKVAPLLPCVWANQIITEQIVGNLVGNALKFVPPGVAPRVMVHAEARGQALRLWVDDNGIGIEPAYHEKVFGLFQRLHTDRQYRGTGLGLAIVRRGVERMGGHAGVESVPGQGSRFWIELPLLSSHEQG